VVQGLVSIVRFPHEAFNVHTVRVRTVDYILQYLDDLTDLPVLPPVLQDDEAEEVTVQNYVFLPAVYVPLVLNSNGYTPKQLWGVLHPALVQGQELDVCLPLVQWMQAASMGTAMLQPLEMGDPIITLPLTSPTADELLLAHWHAILHQALPGLKAPPQSLETALAHMASALIAQTNDNRQAREQKAAEDQEPKLPSARIAVTLPVLLEYLQLPDKRNLPNLWHQWSNCSRSANAYSLAVPIVTARLTQDLLSFNFIGQSTDDLKNGLHPFIISYGNAENRQMNLEVARLYSLLTAGDAMCSLADLETLNSKEVKSIPLTYWELETSLGMFGNLLAVVLGLQHPLTAAFQDMWTLMRSNIQEDLHAALKYRAYVKPTHILCSVQLICYSWFTHCRARLAPPPPDFKAIVHQVLMQVYVLPTLPPQLYQLVYPKKNPLTSNASVPGTVSTGYSTSSSSQSNTSSSLSNASTVSGLTITSGQGTSCGRGARIVNLAPIPNIVNLVPSDAKLRDLIGTSPPPKFNNGQDMCLSFLLRNGCWSNCRRAPQHTSTLTSNEQLRLQQYLAQRLAASRSATVTPANITTTSPPTTSG